MKTFYELKCPSCRANLSVEEGREFIFCQYCGTKILVNDENTYTYRHIDDADVKRADTERMTEWKKLQMEEERRKNSKTGFFIWLAIVAIMVMVGFIMISTGPKDGNDPGYLLLIFAMIVGFGGGAHFISKKSRDDKET